MTTILLAEDDPGVREFSACLLRAMGYTVLEAGSGEEAVALWEHHPHGVDLLFTDLQMPGMNGARLADTLERLQPGLTTLFTSGCVPAAVEEILRYRKPYHFLPKPYGLNSLIKAINETLESNTHPAAFDFQPGQPSPGLSVAAMVKAGASASQSGASRPINR